MNIWIAAADNQIEKVKGYSNASQFTANSKDQNGYTPMHAAAEYAHLDLLRYLEERGGDVNVKDNDGDTPLHACEQPTAAQLSIDLGADLSIQNDEGLTPLQKAEEDGDFPELIAFLREKSGSATKGDQGHDELPENVRFSVEAPQAEQAIPLQVTDEQRAKLSEIIENGTDQDFEDYLKEVLGAKQNEDAKKQKTETENENSKENDNNNGVSVSENDEK